MFKSKPTNCVLDADDYQEVDVRQYSSLKNFISSLLITFFINCFISVFLYKIGYISTLLFAFQLSSTIGFSICTTIHLLLFVVQPRRYTLVYFTVACGLFCGLLIALFLIWVFFDLSFDSALVRDTFFLGVSFGSVISLFFIIRKKLSDTRTRLQEEQIRALKNEKNALQTRLQLLQAQIEPHFLFNTLANIEGLMVNDVETARQMLTNLTSYLRATLKKSRQTSITLHEEVEMVRAYLEIFQIRMGKRLQFRIELADGLEDFAVPPMLIQPLVENSILHGLEPRVEGGEILVNVEQQGDTIRVEVADTGLGLDNSEKQGVGFSNVKERLALYYDDKATMHIKENRPTGLRIIMDLPCSKPQS